MPIVETEAHLIEATRNAWRHIQRCARVSYQSEMDSTPDLVGRCITRGHNSVLRHAVATIMMKASRVVTHQFVRHSVGIDIVQESQRYVTYDDPEVYLPESLRENSLAISAVNTCTSVYGFLVDNGVPPQDARYILPGAMISEMVVTGNVEAWRNLLRARLSLAAQPEFRELATKILAELRGWESRLFEDIDEEGKTK